MGLFDFLRLDERKKDRVAIDFDLQAGVLEECPVCRTVFDRQHDERLAAAEIAVHQAFDNHDPRVAIFNGDRADLLKRLRSARESVPFACICADSG